MKRPQDLLSEVQTMQTLVGLTDIFENIASMHIGEIKNQVLQSQAFFNELWAMYTQIRVDKKLHQNSMIPENEMIDKDLIIIITAEGALSGDIDEKLMNLMLSQYDSHKQDVIVVGHHGALRLANAGVRFKKYYKLPSRDRDINVSPIVQELQYYRSTTVYYQTYISLMVQDVKRISLNAAVQEYVRRAKPGKDEISEKTYIFEPSTYEVIHHLERTMLHVALSQTILDSKLAQYASRFRAMSSAHQLASESRNEALVNYNQAKRVIKDERLKEITNGLRKVSA